MEGYECKVDGGLIMQQWASSRKWGPSPDLEDLPNLTDPLIVHHRISHFHSNSRKRPPSLIWFISWHFVSSDPICCCARSRRSKSLVKISGDFIESGKLGWRKNWLEWRPSASARPNKNYSMIWLFTQMKLDGFCGQIIAAITVGEWSMAAEQKENDTARGQISFIRLMAMSESIRASRYMSVENSYKSEKWYQRLQISLGNFFLCSSKVDIFGFYAQGQWKRLFDSLNFQSGRVEAWTA